eukprot:m.315165 g.315165  ORF g.315165 m.315165 type:complete len:61 (+) comp650732_c0_seq1:84-266(+)
MEIVSAPILANVMKIGQEVFATFLPAIPITDREAVQIAVTAQHLDNANAIPYIVEMTVNT